MLDYGLFRYTSKEEVLEKSIRYWNPGKTRFWQETGVDLVMGRREGYIIHDIDGRRLIDLHINGGTYNLGHRNAELIATLTTALEYFDIGNHWFPSVARTALAEALVNCSPGMSYAVFAPGGAEAADIAIKSARYATKRRKIVSIIKGYHGHAGLSVATGDDRFTKIFLSDRPDEFIQVPFNDLAAMEAALKGRDIAAVILETIPATYGFPMPAPGYLQGVRDLCTKYGTLYIADEVQTGFMRCGQMWGWQVFGVQPDLFIAAKGLSGGLYPIAVCMLGERAGGWLHEDGAAHISTTGGGEVGCFVAMRVLEILQRPETRANTRAVSEFFAEGFADLIRRHPDVVVGLRQMGTVMGVEFDHPEGAVAASRALYETGVWAIFSSLDKRVLQFKPGVLMSRALCEEVIERFDAAIPRLRALIAEMKG
ncbi:aminotransferase class III-fold pyridoxal phosphate-dependent enzyme [Rhodobacter sp. Har01]|uniref:class-III pyridoxal-phosphate-dependent aminotransferase n=1 Tax=Rhodobacter sp. Har01 TaxID=2883999 RepID=UPI001D097B92|nr:aminotransferase class III-fold pyridoxal phosphate-dependent enzyme [Rhodobacter sp. Har01]MCB6179311.1 aminotransferase class III-fold pyridoxal phosphate-dependent enzyme [Rhodobacter sp. Har01]